jgi:hypothetical protein
MPQLVVSEGRPSSFISGNWPIYWLSSGGDRVAYSYGGKLVNCVLQLLVQYCFVVLFNIVVPGICCSCQSCLENC